jgi:hypothetical protein
MIIGSRRWFSFYFFVLPVATLPAPLQVFSRLGVVVSVTSSGGKYSLPTLSPPASYTAPPFLVPSCLDACCFSPRAVCVIIICPSAATSRHNKM